MSNPKRTTIKLHDLFGSTLSTRQAVQAIAERIPDSAKEVLIDFNEITFISRSFAHEFLRFQEKSDIRIKTANVRGEAKQILALVDESRRRDKRHDHEDEITNTSISLSDPSLVF